MISFVQSGRTPSPPLEPGLGGTICDSDFCDSDSRARSGWPSQRTMFRYAWEGLARDQQMLESGGCRGWGAQQSEAAHDNWCTVARRHWRGWVSWQIAAGNPEATAGAGRHGLHGQASCAPERVRGAAGLDGLRWTGGLRGGGQKCRPQHGRGKQMQGQLIRSGCRSGVSIRVNEAD